MPAEQPTEATADRKNSLSYVVITPVRNEAAFIETTLRSVTAQTILPSEWIIVNDGSTDGTGDIVVRYAEHYPWIELINQQDRGYRQRGSGVIDAFYEGFSQITHTTYDVVAKLDGDLSFEPDYFESLLSHFAAWPRLGIAGGGCYIVQGDKLVPESTDVSHVRGPTKVYRRACFEAIGGLVPHLGWDGIDEWKARMLGWKTYTFLDLKVVHNRPTGIATGRLKSYVEQGHGAYYMGYHPLFLVARSLRRTISRPYVIGGLAMMTTYFADWLRGHKRVPDPALIGYLQRSQLQRLMGRAEKYNVLEEERT